MTAKRPFGNALRAAIIVTIVAVIMNLAINLGSDGFYTTFGLFVLLVLSNFGGPLKSRFTAYLVSGAVGMVLIIIGALAATNFIATIVVTLIVSFLLAYSLVLRGYFTPAYISLLLTYIVAVTTPQAVGTLGTAVIAYTAGAIIAGLAAVLMWPSRPTSDIAQAVGAALSAAANIIKINKQNTDNQKLNKYQSEFNSAYDNLIQVYRGNLKRPGEATPRDRGLIRAVDDIGRLHAVINTKQININTGTPESTELMEAVNETLSSCATAMTNGHFTGDLGAEKLLTARTQHIKAMPQQVDKIADTGQADKLIQAVDTGFIHRVISFITLMLLQHTKAFLGYTETKANETNQMAMASEEIASIEAKVSPWSLLSSNLRTNSPWFRRATQIALAVTISVIVIVQLHMQVGFWVILGVIASLQLTAIKSRKAVIPVLIGTCSGFIICALLVMLIGKHIWLLIALLPFVGFFTVWYPRGRYMVHFTQAGYTIWFVMLVSLSHHDMAIATADTRIIDVAVGLCASLIITSLLWSRGVASEVRPILDLSTQAAADYLKAGVNWLASGLTTADRTVVDQAMHDAVKAGDRAAEAFDLAISQGGASAEEAHKWIMVTNVSEQMYFAATMLRGLPGYDLAPIPDKNVATELQKYVEIATEKIVSTSNLEQTNIATQDSYSYKPDLLKTEIIAAINNWPQGKNKKEFTIESNTFTMSRGQAAISMLWTQNWLVYINDLVDSGNN